jgi:hypothetical protein
VGLKRQDINILVCHMSLIGRVTYLDRFMLGRSVSVGMLMRLGKMRGRGGAYEVTVRLGKMRWSGRDIMAVRSGGVGVTGMTARPRLMRYGCVGVVRLGLTMKGKTGGVSAALGLWR